MPESIMNLRNWDQETELQKLPSKEEFLRLCNTLAEEIVEAGEQDLAAYFLKVKLLNEATGAILKNPALKLAAVNDIERDNGKRIILGAELTTKAGAMVLDYAQDQIWSEAQEQINIQKAIQKSREELLKAAYRSKQNSIPDGDGVAVNSVPVKSQGAFSVVVKF